jgi:predicted tellurium resistance membrane protein TerC
MAAVVIAVGVMLVLANTISDFVDHHPTVKILALSFLLLIGMSLVAESLDQHIPKGYIYFAMAFSVFVEILNLRLRAKTAEPVHLHPGYVSPVGVRFTPSPDTDNAM